MVYTPISWRLDAVKVYSIAVVHWITHGDVIACQCGCGESTQNGSFKPGHDQRLRTDLERRVGGILGLRDLVEAA
jgi:hypothetical protein